MQRIISVDNTVGYSIITGLMLGGTHYINVVVSHRSREINNLCCGQRGKPCLVEYQERYLELKVYHIYVSQFSYTNPFDISILEGERRT
jgi:hypothetical protein